MPTSFFWGVFTYGLPSSRGGVYLRCGYLPAVLLGCLPPVGQRCLCLTAWGVYLWWFRLHSAGVGLSIPPVAPADVPAIPAQELGHLPAVLLGKLPAVLKRAYPAGDVYLRWLLHRAWQDACHLENYLRCYRLHGGCVFEYTSGGSCGCACNIPPKSRGHLPPVGQRCLPAVLLVFPPVVSPILGGS